MNKFLATFVLGLLLSLGSLPIMGLAFVFGQAGWWLFVAGLVVGAFGALLAALVVILKLASLLFRA